MESIKKKIKKKDFFSPAGRIFFFFLRPVLFVRFYSCDVQNHELALFNSGLSVITRCCRIGLIKAFALHLISSFRMYLGSIRNIHRIIALVLMVRFLYRSKNLLIYHSALVAN